MAVPQSKPAKPALPPRDGLPIKLESRQSIRALVPVAQIAKPMIARRSSRQNLESMRSETSKANLSASTTNAQNLVHSQVQEDRRSVQNKPMVSERLKAIPIKPVQTNRVITPRAPARPEVSPNFDLRRRGSNSNLPKPATHTIMDEFVTETFEEPPKFSVDSADGASISRPRPTDNLKNTTSTRTSGFVQLDFTKCDSVDLEGSKRASMTPCTDRSLCDTNNKLDKKSQFGVLVDTTSLLEEKGKSSLAVSELLGTFSRLSSAIKGSVEKRREIDRERRRAAKMALSDKVRVLKAQVFERGLVQLRRCLNRSQRLRKWQAIRVLMRVFMGH